METNNVQPLVSVILPVYNVEKYLHKCLDSIVAQTLKNIEIICVDDGSTDSSLDVLKSYAKRDARVKVIHQENNGAGFSRNVGLEVAKGEYVHFFDPDDFCNTIMLEKTYTCAKAGDCDVVVFGSIIYSDLENKILEYKKISKYILQLPPVFSPDDIANKIFIIFGDPPWNKLYRRSFLIKHKLQYQNLPRNNDVYFTRMAICLAKKISVVNSCLYTHRVSRSGSLQTSCHDDTPYTLFDVFDGLRAHLEKENLLAKFEESLVCLEFLGYTSKLLRFERLETAEAFYSKMKQLPIFDPNSNWVLRCLDNLSLQRARIVADICLNSKISDWLLEYRRVLHKELCNDAKNKGNVLLEVPPYEELLSRYNSLNNKFNKLKKLFSYRVGSFIMMPFNMLYVALVKLSKLCK